MDHMNHHAMSGGGFLDLWNPWSFVIILAIGYMYLYLTGPRGERMEGYEPIRGRQRFYMMLALVLAWSVTGTPIAYYGHAELFSAHMLQQSVLYLCVPPLVYLSLPAWLVRPFFAGKWSKRLLYPFTQPLISILSFNLLFSAYHIPFIFDMGYEYPILHTVFHMVLLVSAFQMWFPVFPLVPEWNRLTDLQRMAYIFANGVLLTPACAMIIFAKTMLYDAYVDAPQVIWWLPIHDDQQMGGVIMKIIQELVYGTVLAYSFFSWYRKERRDEDYPGDPNAPSALQGVKP